jgi:hypothetical protein
VRLPGRYATVRWQIWQRVTGRWVTVTGKRREGDLLICLHDATLAGVILHGAHAACTPRGRCGKANRLRRCINIRPGLVLVEPGNRDCRATKQRKELLITVRRPAFCAGIDPWVQGPVRWRRAVHVGIGLGRAKHDKVCPRLRGMAAANWALR